MLGKWLVAVIAVSGCKERRAEPEEPVLDPAIAKIATARLDLVRRSVAAIPGATTSLPTCHPGAGVKVLSRETADVMTGGKGDARIPGYARPNNDDRYFDDLRSRDASSVERAVKNLGDLQGLALFAMDEVEAPVAGASMLISPATIKGRVVVFDLNAKPTCMSTIEVRGGEIGSVHVKKTARSDEIQRAFEYAAEQDITDKLDHAIAATVKNAER